MSSAQDRTGATGATGAPAAGERDTRQEAARYPEPGYPRGAADYGREVEHHYGRTVLAGVLMMLAGLWEFLLGILAIIRRTFYLVTPNYTYAWNVHAWGWTHLALGIVLFAAGASVLLGMTWAKVVGIVLAVFSALATFMFLPHYPFWSIIVIAIDVFIIWALANSLGRSRRTA
jgi:hypothetical protein